ncbi:MAG TPA: asparaginase [Herpetosiphonaceae bacterium]
MSYILCLTTGGTIAMKRGPMVGGAVPSLKGQDFLSLLPRNEHQVVFEEFANLPSSHLTTPMIVELIRRVEARVQLPDVAGVVLTHGTDTLEETAYLLDLTIATSKPIVVTGAMRTANAVGYDGIANLAAAIRIAGSETAQDQGVLVAFNEQIFAAAQVQKVHSQALGAFAAPSGGPLGSTASGVPAFFQRVGQRQAIPLNRLEEPVDLLVVTQGCDDRLLRAAIESGARGIVIEALGSGRVPPWWLPLIQNARARGIPVVITTRAGAGDLGDEYGYVGAYHDLRRLGCLFAPGLNGPKARVKLMLALGAVKVADDVRHYFE